MKSVEIFAGAGGLAMGVSLAGFQSLAVVEWDKWACDTIRENQKRGFPVVENWPLWEGDVRDFDWSTIPEGLDLIAGGPPCQPFSMGGKHRAFGDNRDMFPTTVGIVRKLKPRAFIIENVKGLTRSSFSNYYHYILLQLEFPTIVLRNNETWMDHFRRLQEEKTSGFLHGNELSYNVVPTLVNAADYGVPQKRERVFIVGFRSDLGIEWSFPKATHSYESLLYSLWISGDYWERHKIPSSRRPAVPNVLRKKLSRVKEYLCVSTDKPWRTIRDALVNIDTPQKEPSLFFNNHVFQPGARIYKGHTGSPIDLPAKTLKAGSHGVPGGENMIVYPDGNARYFSVRESARIQTFPDGFVFHGSWTETMRQLGNAVPVALARKVASSVGVCLAEKAIEELLNKKERQAL